MFSRCLSCFCDLPVYCGHKPGKISVPYTPKTLSVKGVPMACHGLAADHLFTLLAIFLFSIPTGRYMARIVMSQKTRFDKFFDPIDNAIYFLIGRQGHKPSDDVEGLHPPYAGDQSGYDADYLCNFLVSGSSAAQQLGFPGMEPFQAFNEAISFITNTNWQSYSGESTLSNFSKWRPSPSRCSPRPRRARRGDGVDSRLHSHKRRLRSRQFSIGF